MEKRTIKNALLAAIAATVLCAGTVSAHQLYRTPASPVCGGSCTKKISCPNILGCECILPSGARIGTCELVAAKPAK